MEIKDAIAFAKTMASSQSPRKNAKSGMALMVLDFYITAIEALEKQNAEKPIYEDGYYVCAKCGERLETYLYSRSITYCSSCGKAHDWREVE